MNRGSRRPASNDRAEFSILLIFFLILGLVTGGGTLQQRAQATGKEATQEVSSALKVVGIYGHRNSSADDLRVLKINVELASGALPVDLQQLIIRYSDGHETRNYGWSDADLRDDEPTDATFFSTDWIRGMGHRDVMEPGDLVEIKFILARDLAERTDVQLVLIPETGASVEAGFRTPATYSTYTTVTLR